MPKYVGRLESTMCRKTMELSRGENFMGSLIFHLIVIVKDIYPSKYPNNHAFNHKLFHIFNYAEITKYYKLVDPDLSVQTYRSKLVGPYFLV